MVSLGVDVAQGGADLTVLAPLYGTWFDEPRCHKGVDTTNGPAVAALVIRERRDGAAVNIDLTGGWGGSARDHLVGNGVPVNGIVFSGASHARTRDGAFRFLNARAELWWRFREALDPENGDAIALPPDKALAAELSSPRWALAGDRIKIEMKEDIRARLGGSTDRADAVILAWHDRRAAAVARHRRKVRRGTWMGM
jgi:hypothetical protein